MKIKNRVFNIVLFVAFITSVTACVTRPISIGRKGLFELDEDEVNSSKVASELYSPKEGERIELEGKWQWPLENISISSSYGERHGKFHQGVDLRAHMKTPVYAASDGVVVYVGSKIRGYGRMVVIKHPGNLYSVYAHHSKNLVKSGAHVSRGDLIAYSGKSGHSTGPHLHFEIRKGTQSYDPVYALNENIRNNGTRTIASEKKPTNSKN